MTEEALVRLVASVIQIIVQLGAVYMAFRLTRTTGGFRAWYLIILALLLMTARRTTALLIETGLIAELGGSIAFFDRILLPLTISVLLLLGMYELVMAFEHAQATG